MPVLRVKSKLIARKTDIKISCHVSKTFVFCKKLNKMAPVSTVLTSLCGSLISYFSWYADGQRSMPNISQGVWLSEQLRRWSNKVDVVGSFPQLNFS